MVDGGWKDRTVRRYAYGPHHDTGRAEFLGSGYGGWWVCPDGLERNAVVYSFGVGEDISFDLAIIERHGVRVFAFDPTPRAIQWMASQRPPYQLSFEAVGIADFDGTAIFTPPAVENHASYALAAGGTGTASPVGAVEGPVRRLATLMAEHGHDELALLKMDIEGGEYRVIEDIAASPLRVRQLLVEFHPGSGLRGWRRTRRAVRALRRSGFAIARVSEGGREVTFIRKHGG